MKDFNLEQFKQGVKARTRDGRIATFVAICDGCGEYSRVVAHTEGCPTVSTFNTNGAFMEDGIYVHDLVSMVSPWEDVPIDAKVRVKAFPEDNWLYYHYAGLEDGKPTAWNDGRTSWSSVATSRYTWEIMELVED